MTIINITNLNEFVNTELHIATETKLKETFG